MRKRNYIMSEDFPEEITFQIFLGLPVKSLIICSVVCKSWRSLVRNPIFIRTHLSRTIQTNKQADFRLLLMAFAEKENASRIYSLHWDNSEFGEYTMLINRFAYDQKPIVCDNVTIQARFFDVIRTCNGLVCLVSNATYFDFEAIVIWNPSVRKFVILPRPSVTLNTVDPSKRVASYAFAYDSCSNDYKVLRTLSHFNGPTEVEVWSLASSSWRSVSSIEGFVSFHEPAFVNGTFHWTQRYPENRANRIMSFDMVSESFGEIMISQVCLKEKVFCHILLSYGDNLAIIVVDPDWRHGFNYHMWVMTEYGVVESWTKLFTVRLQNMIDKPFICRKNGDLVLKMVRGWLISVDPETEQAKDFRKDGYKYYFMDSYIESLVLLDQSNAISY